MHNTHHADTIYNETKHWLLAVPKVSNSTEGDVVKTLHEHQEGINPTLRELGQSQGEHRLDTNGMDVEKVARQISKGTYPALGGAVADDAHHQIAADYQVELSRVVQHLKGTMRKQSAAISQFGQQRYRL